MRLIRYTLAFALFAFFAFIAIPAAAQTDTAAATTLKDLRRACATATGKRSYGYLCDDTTLVKRWPTTQPPTPTPTPTPTPIPTPTPVTTSIALTIVRFDTTAAQTVTVANGIPLAPGLLAPAALGTVHIVIAGVEQPMYVEDLGVRHADGSLRAVYVAFPLTIASGQSVVGELRIGGARSTTLAHPAIARSIPQAAALPSSADYLVTTDLVLPTRTVAATRALSPIAARYDSLFCCTPVLSEGGQSDPGFAAYHWRTAGDGRASADAALSVDYYDRALGYYAAWVRTGNPTYWYRGTRIATTYRDLYLWPSVQTYGGSQPYTAQLEGLEKHYVLTGDSLSRRTVLGQTTISHVFWTHFNEAGLNNAYTDDRSHARVIMAFLLAWRLDPNGSTPNDPMHDATPPERYAGILAAVPGKVRTLQDSVTGRDTTYGAAQLAYMQGMLGDALIAYSHWYGASPVVTAWMTRSAAWLWTQTKTNGASYQYASQAYMEANGAGGDTTSTADLNLLLANTFGFVYRATGDGVWKARGDATFAGGVNGAWLFSAKAFNQNYEVGWAYPALVGPAALSARRIPVKKP